MIVHIFPYKLYTAGFVDLVNQFFNPQDHLFLIYGKVADSCFKVKDYFNLVFLSTLAEVKKNQNVYQKVIDCEKLIVHANNIFITKFFLKNWCLLKKTYIVFWGFDIYCYRIKERRIKKRAYQMLSMLQIRQAKAVCTLTDKDMTVLNNLVHGIKGKHFPAVYTISTEDNELIKMRLLKKPGEFCKVIVGNSASETNHHVEILNQLSCYKEEKIEIICPLSYGSDAYRQKVIAVGQEIFGEKFVPLVELMDVQKYWQLLNGCKIGIFNNDRQQAMGNINTLLALGAKVYIRRDTSMWDKYRSEGYQMYDVEELGRVNWKTVISYDEQVQLFNSDNYFRQNSNENRAKIWNAIFTDEV